jgi:protein tyrosine phosphatase (PTP) superfamily phosphohydrolase (DUF442 family)
VEKLSSSNRPASWAQPVELAGAPNLHQVSTNLYRSAQPTEQGMKGLKQKGIETIVNLRSFHSDRDEIGETGLGYEHIYMKAWHPERKEAVRFLQIATNPGRTPVLVHCLHGSDRTGTMCAIYRIAVQGWSKDEAIREMTLGGFGFHEVFANLPAWIQELDIESLKKDAGIKTGTEQSELEKLEVELIEVEKQIKSERENGSGAPGITSKRSLDLIRQRHDLQKRTKKLEGSILEQTN